jgi:hypothetical protein
MLKPPEPAEEPQSERPVGELVHQLVEQGKAYALAELAVAKAIATAKDRALELPDGLFVAALLVAQAAILTIALAVFFALSAFMHPLLAGLIAFLVFAAIAGGLGWFGAERLRRDW